MTNINTLIDSNFLSFMILFNSFFTFDGFKSTEIKRNRKKNEHFIAYLRLKNVTEMIFCVAREVLIRQNDGDFVMFHESTLLEYRSNRRSRRTRT